MKQDKGLDKGANMFVPQSLPTNGEIRILVEEAYKESLKDLKESGE